MKKPHFTIGQIAKHFGVRTHKIAYVIRHLSIVPTDRVAHYRLFNHRQLDLIGRELDRIRARSRGPADA